MMLCVICHVQHTGPCHKDDLLAARIHDARREAHVLEVAEQAGISPAAARVKLANGWAFSPQDSGQP